MSRPRRLWREYLVVERDGWRTTFVMNQLGVGTMSCSPIAGSIPLSEIRRSVPYAEIRVEQERAA